MTVGASTPPTVRIARTAVVLVALLAACQATPIPTPPVASPTGLPDGLVVWSAGARDMVWRHVRQGPPPDLRAARIETCADYAIVFFFDRDIDQLLWAAGRLSESPEGADGGFVAAGDAARLAADRRAGQVNCRVVFEAAP